ncbi:MAG: hypothetical protein IJQ81_14155 [Oscillibacter sp.]|nr:hypothetical protein [Oscillibacter sp.]
MEVRLTGTLEEITRLFGEDKKPWLPASVRTPEAETPVIVCYKSKGKFVVGMGAFHENKWHVYASGVRRVEFWRPFPDPPFEQDAPPET